MPVRIPQLPCALAVPDDDPPDYSSSLAPPLLDASVPWPLLPPGEDELDGLPPPGLPPPGLPPAPMPLPEEAPFDEPPLCGAPRGAPRPRRAPRARRATARAVRKEEKRCGGTSKANAPRQMPADCAEEEESHDRSTPTPEWQELPGHAPTHALPRFRTHGPSGG